MPRSKRTVANLVTFPGKIGNKVTLSELVLSADRIPASQIEAAIAARLDRLGEAGEAMPRLERLRQWVIIGALVNRLLFELHQIPKDPGFLL